LLQAQNTGTGLPSFGSFTSGGFDTVNNQNLNVLFSIPLISSAGRGMPLNLPLTYNSLVYQNYQNTWLPAPPYGEWGWFQPGTGSVTWTSQLTSFRCGTGYGTQTRYYNYSFVDILGTSHPVPAISFLHYSCGNPWSGTFSGTASDNSGYYLDASTLHPYATVTTPSGAQALNPLNYMADTNGNYISETVVSSTETDWTDSVGNKAAKVIYNPSQSAPTSVQFEFLDGSGNYQTITLKYQSYPIKTNFACSGVTEYTGTAYLPYELDIPSPVSGTLTYKFTYEQTPGLSGYYSGRLQQVTLPTGGYYQYTYPGVNDSISCSDGTTLKMNRVVSDGTNSATWNFVRNTANSTTTVTTPQLADTPNANDTVYGFNSLGQETSRKIYANSPGTTLWRTINTTWASNSTPATQVTILEDNSTKAEADTWYDSNGLIDEVAEYDWGTGAHGSASWIRSTYYSYLGGTNYTSRNILNLVTSKVIKDGSGTIQYRQDTAYDGNTITNCPTGVPQHDDTDYPCSMNYRGNPTTVTTYTSPSVPSGGIPKNFTYDVFGNLLTAQLNCCQSKTWSYSAATQYSQPDSVTSGTSPTLTTSYLYNLYLGLVTKATDPNNLVTNYSYDFLRRPTQISQVNGSTSGESISYAYDDVHLTTATTTAIDSSKSVQQITGVDGLGRPNLSTIEDINNNVISNVNAKYDLAGGAYSTSNPYTGSASYWTTTALDVLGRPSSVTLPDKSATSYAYSTNTVTATDPAGKQRESTFDAAGRLTVVTEPDVTNSNKLTLNTTYTYTVLDALASVTTPDQVRTYTYDALGRLVSSVTPEGGTTCFGTVTSDTCNANGYDNFNNLLYRTDARGVLTTYGYDGLNRLTGVGYTTTGTTAQATPSVRFTYGTNVSQYNNGLLITTTDGVGSENYSYNPLEQMTQLQKVINGTTYTTSYAYNLAGELTQITYPSGRVIQQSVDTIGRLCEIAPSTTGCGTAASPYATGYSYSPAQQLTGFNYGNGVTASLGYSTDGRLQLNSISYGKSGTTLFGLTYAYGTAPNNNGQITSITDSMDNGRSVTYTYDGLARLSTAVTPGSANYAAWGLKQTYDRYGNRWSQTAISGCTGQTCPQPSVSFNAATNRINSTGYAYDANGNMTNDGVNTLVYDAENRSTSASNGSSAGAYIYDGNGLRVEKCVPNCTSPTTYTTYVFSGSKVVAEYDNGAAPSAPSREYVYGGSALLAKIDSSGTKYYHQDQLSNRLVTSSTGAVLAQMGHFPFGESWYNATNDKLFFTTYERDAESGNDYAQARYYVNRLALFSALDSISGDNSDPQSLNLYPYVRNDPIDFLDPTGQFRAAVCVIPAYANCGLGGGGGNDSWEGELIDFAFTPTFWCENGPVLGNLGALDLLDPGSPIGSGVGGAANNGPANSPANPPPCQAKVLNATNNQFGTNYTDANVNSTFNFSTGAPPGQGTLNLNIYGSTAGVSPGYYPVHWWTYAIGYGPTLHAVSGPGGNGGLDSTQTLPFGPNQATFHIDSGFPYNPIGAFFHWLLNMTKAGGYPQC